eukprot:5881389-Ditylum_brightwellii.AAC.1
MDSDNINHNTSILAISIAAPEEEKGRSEKKMEVDEFKIFLVPLVTRLKKVKEAQPKEGQGLVLVVSYYYWSICA